MISSHPLAWPEGWPRTTRTRGASHLLQRAQSGFARLPAAQTCWEVLGLRPGASRDVIEARYRELARKHHPDHGGDSAMMARINAAHGEAIA